MLEVDKEWFQIQIRSLEEKLERRNDRAKNLEVSNKEYQDRFVNFLSKILKSHSQSHMYTPSCLTGCSLFRTYLFFKAVEGLHCCVECLPILYEIPLLLSFKGTYIVNS